MFSEWRENQLAWVIMSSFTISNQIKYSLLISVKALLMPYCGCSIFSRMVSKGPHSFFKRPVGHVEHPGPNMSFSHGEAETQAEHRQFPRHLRQEEVEVRLKITATQAEESKSEPEVPGSMQ